MRYGSLRMPYGPLQKLLKIQKDVIYDNWKNENRVELQIKYIAKPNIHKKKLLRRVLKILNFRVFYGLNFKWH